MEKEESIKNRAVIYIENPCVIFYFFSRSIASQDEPFELKK